MAAGLMTSCVCEPCSACGLDRLGGGGGDDWETDAGADVGSGAGDGIDGCTNCMLRGGSACGMVGGIDGCGCCVLGSEKDAQLA